MNDVELRAMRRAAWVLLGAGALRWGGEALRGPPAPPPGPDTLAALLAESRAGTAEARRRSRPLARGERLDPNRAPAAELDRLPGIGPATARAVVEAREEAGGFARPEDLLGVRGVGPATLERIGPFLDFSEGTPATLGRTKAPERGRGAGPVDVNRADEAALETLPGIGPALARRIVEARREAPFGAVEDLLRVPGIGPVTLERLRSSVTVGR